MLNEIHTETPANIIALIIKLVEILALSYHQNLLNNSIVKKIMNPLISRKIFSFNELSKETITMNLQCILTLLKLSEVDNELKTVFLMHENVQSIVALSLKNGTIEHRTMAIDLLKIKGELFPSQKIAKVIIVALSVLFG